MRKILLAALITALLVTPAFASLTPQQARSVWQQVALHTGLEGLPFYCRRSITPNAWVSSGKSVTVTTSLLEMLETEDELYGVLAHEAGHVKLRHNGKTIQRQLGASILTSVISSLIGGAASPVASVTTGLANAGYSRKQEIESDDFAVKLAFDNGHDPHGLYSALVKLSKHQKTEPDGFNSHPPDERRLRHISNTIDRLKPSDITSDKTFAAQQKALEEAAAAKEQQPETVKPKEAAITE